MATKSRSAIEPTCLSTFKAAIATAGSFVLIALIRGTIFSCIVYLSRALDPFVFVGATTPLRPSSFGCDSGDPPHSITKACKPLTLIPKLLVLLNTVAITGNSSFLIVLKSSIGSIMGKARSAASTIACVGDSMARTTRGRISTDLSAL